MQMALSRSWLSMEPTWLRSFFVQGSVFSACLVDEKWRVYKLFLGLVAFNVQLAGKASSSLSS